MGTKKNMAINYIVKPLTYPATSREAQGFCAAQLWCDVSQVNSF